MRGAGNWAVGWSFIDCGLFGWVVCGNIDDAMQSFSVL